MNKFTLVSLMCGDSVFNFTDCLVCLVEQGDQILLKVLCEVSVHNLENIFNLGVSFDLEDGYYRFYYSKLSIFGMEK